MLKNNDLPELKESKNEVEEINRLFKSKQLKSLNFLYDEANEKNFKKYSDKYDIIHLATHSLPNAREPEYSGVFFAKDDKDNGILYASEVATLDLNADLIVLSSCETGLGKGIQGEGVLSLARDFKYAGGSNVVFSLWKVFDKYTKDLMVKFYKTFLSGKTYSQALHEAKLELINDPVTAYPKNWAGFILIGR